MTDIGAPPAAAIEIGPNQRILLAWYKDEEAGVNEYHKSPAGNWCMGWVPFRGKKWSKGFEEIPGYQSWDVVQLEPLTLTPSIKCRVCGNHGHITNGKWVPAQ